MQAGMPVTVYCGGLEALNELWWKLRWFVIERGAVFENEQTFARSDAGFFKKHLSHNKFHDGVCPVQCGTWGTETPAMVLRMCAPTWHGAWGMNRDTCHRMMEAWLREVVAERQIS